MTRAAYVCTNCPKGQDLYATLNGIPQIIEVSCLGDCQYAPRVVIAAEGEEIQLGSRRIGEPLNIKPLGKNPRATIEALLRKSI